MVNLELYRVFYTVAKCGSLTKAAEELYISQPAVSQSIKQLENQLGTTLFNRTHRGMELSERGGKLIFSKIEQALALFGEAETTISQVNSTATGTIRIGASDNIFEYFLADKIVEYREKFPAVKIELCSDITPRVLDKVKANQCDVAFVNMPVEIDHELVLHGNCMRLSDIFVTSDKYSELKKGVVTMKQLKKYPLVMMEKKTIARKVWDEFFQMIGVDMQPSLEIGDWDLMKRFVINGMGVGIIPREYAEHRLADGSMFEIQTDPALPARSVGMVLSKNAKVPYVMKAFLDMFDF